MADTIKIPFGFVIATSPEEFAGIVSAIKLAIKLIKETPQVKDEFNDGEFYEKLLTDLLTTKSTYGSGSMH